MFTGPVKGKCGALLLNEAFVKETWLHISIPVILAIVFPVQKSILTLDDLGVTYSVYKSPSTKKNVDLEKQ